MMYGVMLAERAVGPETLVDVAPGPEASAGTSVESASAEVIRVGWEQGSPPRS
jgi:hypothetical protein